jgi:hypothetical protein
MIHLISLFAMNLYHYPYCILLLLWYDIVTIIIVPTTPYLHKCDEEG